MITSLCSSLMPEFADLSCDSLTGKTDKPLVVTASGSMGAGIQQRFVEYVKNGGILLMLPVIPSMGENFEPCTILGDFIGAHSEACGGGGANVRVGDVRGIINNDLWTCVRRPDNAVPFAFDERSGAVAGWKAEYPGGGAVVWLGIKWRHDKLVLNKMMRWLFNLLGVSETAVECDNPYVWAVLRSGGDKRMLFLMNLFSSPLEAGVRIKEHNSSYTDACRHFLKPMEVKTVVL